MVTLPPPTTTLSIFLTERIVRHPDVYTLTRLVAVNHLENYSADKDPLFWDGPYLLKSFYFFPVQNLNKKKGNNIFNLLLEANQ